MIVDYNSGLAYNGNIKMKTILRTVVIIIILVSSISSIPAQNEPVGPPEDPRTWMKTLNQIEPRTLISSIPFSITNSGSYYLTQNLTGDDTVTNGITIDANDVCLDLCGFVLSGTTNGWCGISLTGADNRNIIIKNGVVRGWGQSGLFLQNGMSCRLSNITAINNGTGPSFAAIYVGQDWDVEDCSASGNMNGGFFIGNNSRAKNCKARGNSAYGFMIGNGGRVENCSASENKENGFEGGMMSMILSCSANNNTNNGIYVGLYSIASGNISSYNRANGIRAGTGSRVEKNVSTQNGGCGIYAEGFSRVTENQIVQNSGPNIYGNTGCRIDHNHVYGGPIGIQSDVDSYGSLYVANSVVDCSTSYIVTIGSSFGQILNNSIMEPSTNFNVSNPWANFNLQ